MCGIIGVYSPGDNVVHRIPFGLQRLQHRGQDGAGMSWMDEDDQVIYTYKDFGLVREVLNSQTLGGQCGYIGTGQVRYATTGSVRDFHNLQPVVGERSALVHNGNMVNAKNIRDKLIAEGFSFSGTSDTKVIATQIHKGGKGIREQIMHSMRSVFEPSYSCIVQTRSKLIAFRDPMGNRPLSIGTLDNGFVIASETCVFDLLGAEFHRDVMPGEMVCISDEGLQSTEVCTCKRKAFCMFEFVYNLRPDSLIEGREVLKVRANMGKFLAQADTVEADYVIPVPDSGKYAAQGYHEESGIPYREWLIKDPQAIRTFIEPTQEMRERAVWIKLNASTSIRGKRLIVVDDSIVRGTTSKKLVQMLREKGAREVHFRVAASPISHPCFYGTDTYDEFSLIARMHDQEEIRQYIGADSLAYLSEKDMVASTGYGAENLCLACFNGEYPAPIPDYLANQGKEILEA